MKLLVPLNLRRLLSMQTQSLCHRLPLPRPSSSSWNVEAALCAAPQQPGPADSTHPGTREEQPSLRMHAHSTLPTDAGASSSRTTRARTQAHKHAVQRAHTHSFVTQLTARPAQQREGLRPLQRSRQSSSSLCPTSLPVQRSISMLSGEPPVPFGGLPSPPT